MLVRLSEALPVLESVTDCAALVVPTGWLAKVSEEAERLTTGAEAAAPVLVRFSEALPVLESVTVCATLVVPTGWLAKVSEEAERLTTGAEAAAPVPVRLTDCGLPEVLSAMLKVPVRVPDAVGVNVVLIVQFAPTATEVPQV